MTIRLLLTIGLAACPTIAWGQTANFETCTPGLLSAPCAPELWAPSIVGWHTIEPFGPVTASYDFPTEGSQWLILDSSSTLGSGNPIGGPAPLPFASDEAASIIFHGVVTQTPIRFDYNYVSAEDLSSGFNDCFTVDLVEPITGVSVANVLYIDTAFSGYDPLVSVLPDATGFPSSPFENNAHEVAPIGKVKSVLFDVPTGLIGRTLNLEFHVSNGADHKQPSYAWLDNIQMGADGSFASCAQRAGQLGLNPAGYACQSLPLSGSSWSTSIDMTPLPGSTAVRSVVVVGWGGPTSGGVFAGYELLTASPFFTHFATGSHTLPIPPGLAGLSFATQGVRIELDGLGAPQTVLLNAIDVVIG